MKACLYRVVHKVSSHDYVGVSTQPEKRWAFHKRWASAGKGKGFADALRKHGPEAFTWKIIAWASCFQGALALEKMARHLGLGYYNLTAGGDGRTLTDEHKEKLRLAHVGIPLPTETRQKIATAHAGGTKSHKGKSWTEKRRAAELTKRKETGRSTKGKPWSAARRAAWLASRKS
jgi:predicted GIY-YIG superfamily endonuclease